MIDSAAHPSCAAFFVLVAGPPGDDRQAPHRAEPVHATPVHAEPMRAEPPRAEAPRAEPVRAEPVAVEPARSAPSSGEKVEPRAEQRIEPAVDRAPVADRVLAADRTPAPARPADGMLRPPERL